MQLAQSEESEESRRHSNPSSSGSEEEKVKLTLPLLMPDGPESIVVSGAVVSVSWNFWIRLLPWSTT